MNVGYIGMIFDDILHVIGNDGTDLIGDVCISLGKGSIRRTDVRGQIVMIEAVNHPNAPAKNKPKKKVKNLTVNVDSNNQAKIDHTINKYENSSELGTESVLNEEPTATTYDIVAFSLIREMFGLEFPRVGTIQHKGVLYIICNRFPDRALKLEDYWPNNNNNLLFRYRLAMIIYLCKMVGCPLHLSDIRVLDGWPIYWRCPRIGYKSCHTITDAEFLKIFGFELAKAEKGLGNYMARAVIEYFRSVDFDTDELRGMLYLKDEMVRSAKGKRVKYGLTRKPREIEDLIEENYSILLSSYPFNIFHR